MTISSISERDTRHSHEHHLYVNRMKKQPSGRVSNIHKLLSLQQTRLCVSKDQE